MDQILAHTDGAPLFIEELTKMVLEGGLLRERDGKYVLEGPLPPLAIPTTLQASTLRRTGVISTRTESRRLIPSWPCRVSGTAYFNFVEKKVTRTTVRLERGKGSSGVT